ncbi:acetylcholine receptor subunit alpha-like 1 [Gigantopelta aegis]|uniref:acetylcholine receptor subunit alpha-like 1 n=1 Tax=Gigantopelta aegis TaxID=1735272 RepID=UPI001B88C2D6|nr:acetylcholine receptor subunit alpha-like 1 [Gigantopelta aegis]
MGCEDGGEQPVTLKDRRSCQIGKKCDGNQRMDKAKIREKQDEKNQIIKISVWLRQEWFDMRLHWDPEEYSGVTKLHIPSNDLWKPDLVLYNNADGDFVVTLQTKATVHHNGWIVWEPPAIYKSYCEIDVEFFPFDMQECFLKFGSWTYDGTQLDLQHVCDNGIEVSDDIFVIDRGIDLRDFYANIEWDIINVTAQRRVKYYPCCPEPYPDIMFNVTLRRRTLFYTLNLIMPCISISCLTVLVFYLPADSAEKITLCISILLALTMFFLLLSDITPPTSLVIPLIGKYLLFVLIVVSLSIFLTVYTLHINFKTPTTHKMSPWVRKVFTEILPRILLMKRPVFRKKPTVGVRTCNGIEMREQLGTSSSRDLHTYENVRQRQQSEEPEGVTTSFSPKVTEALYGVKFIADHLKKEDEDMMEVHDWKYIAMVMDRFFLVIFSTACFCGTVSIFLFAPSLYDPREPLAKEDPNNTCIY